MDIRDKKLWEGIVIGFFLLFVAFAAFGGILSLFCYLASEPATCLAEFSVIINAISLIAGLAVFVLWFWFLYRKS
jgi:hypothetical protein